MKTLKYLMVVGLLVVGILPSVAMAASGAAVDLGARYHQKHSEFVGLPYADGDWTYVAGYEIQDENGMLQLACGFTPEFADHKDYDYGITPEANLLMKDGMFQGGLGILSTYTRDGEGKGDWMDMYWQWVLGLNVPLGSRLSIQANAYYVFEKWGTLNKFKFDDIEFGGYLSYKF
ncbi:MAG: hypothetical protein WCO42_06150 [bacterium]